MANTSAWTRNFYPRGGAGVAFERVVFFSDAVYAIALTLIAVEIGIPEIEGDTTSPAVLWDALQDKAPRIGAFIAAFAWVAAYWRANHRFTMTLRGMDAPYVRVVLLYLGFVAFLPLPAAMLGEYWDNPLAVALFATYAACVSCIEVLLMFMASRGDLFLAPLGKQFGRQQVLGSLSPVAAFAISIPIAFYWSPLVAILFWFVGTVLCGLLIGWLVQADPPPDPLPGLPDPEHE